MNWKKSKSIQTGQKKQFAYKPMYGIIIAFKDYSMRKGITGSPWSGFDNFQRLFSSYWSVSYTHLTLPTIA